MARTLSNPMRQLLVMMLVAGISVCCCQARVVLLGSGNGDSCCTKPVKEVVVPSCCAAEAGQDAEQCSPEDTDDAPNGCCDCCCVNATIVQNASADHVTVPSVAVAVPALPFVGLSPAAEVRPLAVTSVCPWYRPPTLLHLHCVLLV